MKVIVASMSKTGTKTLCEVLTVLGYEVYDWMENFWYLGDEWVKLIEEGIKVDELRRMYRNIDAVTDSPCHFYWEELFEAFPDAKVILTLRDEESWYRSLVKQFDDMNVLPALIALTVSYTGYRMNRYHQITSRGFGYKRDWPFLKCRLHDEEALKRMYRKHNSNVQQKVPKNQLLVMNMNDLAWQPICEFLDLPIPDRPFPHKNKGGDIVKEMQRTKPPLRRLGAEVLAFYACLALLVAFGVYRLFTST